MKRVGIFDIPLEPVGLGRSPEAKFLYRLVFDRNQLYKAGVGLDLSGMMRCPNGHGSPDTTSWRE